MAEYTAKLNKKGLGHGKKKFIIAAVSVFVVILLAVVAFFISKDTLFFHMAKSQAENGNFGLASTLTVYIDDEKADILEDYIDLRMEINESYPVLVTDYNADTVAKWSYAAEKLCMNSDALGDALSAEINSLSRILIQISASEIEYIALKPDILDLMDVFGEINRLHTKDAEGKNISFTIAAERAKISTWTQLSNEILDFISGVPGNENIYLFNYMAKEAQGEISELTAAIDGVAASGYADEDVVRFSGDAEKKFPDITNGSGDRVNLLDKGIYERFMYEEFCKELVQNLAPYYSIH